jgi:hypothetical protein
MTEQVWPGPAYDDWADTAQTLQAFLHSTYEAAADLAHWPSAELERQPSGAAP